MKQIILERNLPYAYLENYIYLLVVSASLFFGIYFSNLGETAKIFQWISGIVALISITFILIQKGLIINENLIFKGYYLFGYLLLKTKIENLNAESFTLIKAKHRQKYMRTRREPNLEYSISSYNLYFLDNNQTHKKLLQQFFKEENALKAIDFLVQNTKLKFVDL